MDQRGNRNPKGNQRNFRGGAKPGGGRGKPSGQERPLSNGQGSGANRGGRPGEAHRKPFGEGRPSAEGQRPFGRGGKPGEGRGKPSDRSAKFSGERRGFGGGAGNRRFGKPGAKRPQAGPAAPQGPSARDVALRAIQNVFRDDAYAAQALDRELNAVQLSADDRRLAASLFYFTLENRLRIERCIRRKVEVRPEPEIMDILDLAVAQILFMDRIPDHAAVDEAVKQTRRAGREGLTSLVNAVLRGLIRDRDAGALTLPDRETEPEAYISEKYSVALPLVERLARAYGMEETERIAAWTPDRHSDVIRPNRLRMTDAEFEAWLDANRFEWARAAVPGAYRVTGAGRLAAHEGYRRGLFSIQGESSMLAAAALCARPGMQVLDACAAPGGKSCLIAETMRGAGRVYAWDLHEHRVELIHAAARRLGLDNIRPQARDASKRNESLLGMMDAVLVDAPCSGLGVMGGKPDIKYRLTAETIEALVPIQRDILNACAGYVRPGGLLVYSTCTILPEENEEQVAAFLKAHPEFEPDADARWLPEALRGRCEGGMLQLLPSRDGMDGFFIARLRRKEGSDAG